MLKVRQRLCMILSRLYGIWILVKFNDQNFVVFHFLVKLNDSHTQITLAENGKIYKTFRIIFKLNISFFYNLIMVRLFDRN